MLKKLVQVHRYTNFLRLTWWKLATPYFLKQKGLKFAVTCRFFGKPVVSIFQGSDIKIGDRTSLCSDSRYTALGVNHPIVLRTLRNGALIAIGADVGISGASICAAQRIEIGDHCLIGANVTISDTDFHATKYQNRRYNNNELDISAKPVIIGRNVFVGTAAIILKGVKIGDNSVIGAGSVVTHNVPENSIAAGNPAKVIGTVGHSVSSSATDNKET